ncbi:MAG: nucleotidyltransferase domain-containing protein [Nitrospirae bacterium]|nr:nucleotidyltransferase domain-containing protein [Nitrospirota bacterium]
MGIVREANPAALNVAREFAKKIHELFPDAIVKLFGSAVRGEMEELSDIDIYIELPDRIDMEAVMPQLSEIAWEIGLEHGQVIQEVIYKKSEIWDSPLRSSPFIKAVIREGITL